MAEPPPKRQRLDFSAGSIVTFCVGRGKIVKTFKVHKSVATKSSEFIKTALARDGSIEAQAKRIELPDHAHDSFDGYLNWLYSNEIIFKNPTKAKVYSEIAHMYILGHYLQDMKFCDVLVESYKSQVHEHNGCLPMEVAKTLWERTPRGNRLQKCVLASCVGYANAMGAEGPEDYEIRGSLEFWVDLMCFIASRYRPAIQQDWVQTKGGIDTI